MGFKKLHFFSLKWISLRAIRRDGWERKTTAVRKKKPGFFGHLAISRPGAGYRTDKPGTSFLLYQIAWSYQRPLVWYQEFRSQLEEPSLAKDGAPWMLDINCTINTVRMITALDWNITSVKIYEFIIIPKVQLFTFGGC